MRLNNMRKIFVEDKVVEYYKKIFKQTFHSNFSKTKDHTEEEIVYVFRSLRKIDKAKNIKDLYSLLFGENPIVNIDDKIETFDKHLSNTIDMFIEEGYLKY